MANKCSNNNLYGQTFSLNKIDGITSESISQVDEAIHLKFIDTNNYQLQLTANKCTGNYTLNDDKITLNRPACTKMCCDSPESNQVKRLMSSIYSYSLKDGELFLNYRKEGKDGFLEFTHVSN